MELRKKIKLAITPDLAQLKAVDQYNQSFFIHQDFSPLSKAGVAPVLLLSLAQALYLNEGVGKGVSSEFRFHLLSEPLSDQSVESL